MTTSATVEIVDARSGAIKVYARDITEGDAVFDTTGGTHKVVRIQQRRNSPWRTLVRDDGWESTHRIDDIVTILPDGNLGREIDFESSASSQGYIETGFRNTLDETAEFATP